MKRSPDEQAVLVASREKANMNHVNNYKHIQI